MRRRLRAVAPCILILVSLHSDRAGAFEVGSRWNYTATNGFSTGSQGSPITLTWSFAPDGTTIPSDVSSNLISFLETNLGAGPGGSDYTQRPWFGRFQQSFDRLSALSGVTYVYEPNDDGRSFAQSTSARGSLGVRGDIRLGGKSYGAGSNTLASNFYPSYGEMMLNTDEVSFFSATSNNNRAFRNVVTHEAMHGLGIRHVESSSSRFLMEPNISSSFDGPQLDDLLALQRMYGDVYEKDDGNDTFDRATPLGVVSPSLAQQLGTLGSSTAIASTQTDFLSIDDNSDTDYFSFSVDSRLNVQLQMTPRGTTYMVGPQDDTQVQFNTLTLSDLSLALFDTNGTSMLGLADANPTGGAEVLTQQLLPGTYYARVTGAQNDIQLYGLQVTATTPLPADLVWVGNLSNVWNTGTTANFMDEAAAAAFYDLDNVLFDDISTAKTVHLPSNVSAGQILITTDEQYVFTGAGGIVAGSVTIDGTGTVEFANVGNAYLGPTVIEAGMLRLTGSGSIHGTVRVDQGASLEVGSSYGFQAGSRLTGEGHLLGDWLMPGTIAPGASAGMLTLADDLSLTATSVLEIELGGTQAGIDFDLLNIGGQAELAGTLEIELIDGYMLTAGDAFEFLTAASDISGTFDAVTLPALGAGLLWNLHYNAGSVQLEIAAEVIGLPGDYNDDGVVDAADYTVWRDTLGSTTFLAADGDGSGTVDGGDYDVWVENFGASLESGSTGGSLSQATVPEPAALSLLATSLAALLLGRWSAKLPRRAGL